jgi:hypothetical protein
MDHEVRTSVRLPTELHARLAAHAKLERRSFNSDLVYLLEVALGGLEVDADPGGSASPAPLRGKPDSCRK